MKLLTYLAFWASVGAVRAGSSPTLAVQPHEPQPVTGPDRVASNGQSPPDGYLGKIWGQPGPVESAPGATSSDRPDVHSGLGLRLRRDTEPASQAAQKDTSENDSMGQPIELQDPEDSTDTRVIDSADGAEQADGTDSAEFPDELIVGQDPSAVSINPDGELPAYPSTEPASGLAPYPASDPPAYPDTIFDDQGTVEEPAASSEMPAMMPPPPEIPAMMAPPPPPPPTSPMHHKPAHQPAHQSSHQPVHHKPMMHGHHPSPPAHSVKTSGRGLRKVCTCIYLSDGDDDDSSDTGNDQMDGMTDHEMGPMATRVQMMPQESEMAAAPMAAEAMAEPAEPMADMVMDAPVEAEQVPTVTTHHPHPAGSPTHHPTEHPAQDYGHYGSYGDYPELGDYHTYHTPAAGHYGSYHTYRR